MKTTLYTIVENGKVIQSFSCPCDAEYYLMQMNAGDPQNPFNDEQKLKFKKLRSAWDLCVEDDYRGAPDIEECEMKYYEKFGFTRDEVSAWDRYMDFSKSNITREIQKHPADL